MTSAHTTESTREQSFEEWLAESAPSLSRYFNRNRDLDWLTEPDAPSTPQGFAAVDARARRIQEDVRFARAQRNLVTHCVDPEFVRDVTTADDRPPVLDSDSRFEVRAARALKRYESEPVENWGRIEKSTGIDPATAESEAAREVDDWTVRQARFDLAHLNRFEEKVTDYDERDDRELRTRRGVAGEHAWTLEVLGQLRIDWREMRRRAARVRGCSLAEASHDPQVEAIRRHAESMRHRFNYRRYIAALAAEHLTADDSEDRGSLIYAQQLALVDAWRRHNRLSYATACEKLQVRVERIRDRWVGVDGLITTAPVVSRGERWEYVPAPAPVALREVEPHRGPAPRRYSVGRPVVTDQVIREMYARMRGEVVSTKPPRTERPVVTVEFAEKTSRWHNRHALLAPRKPRFLDI